MNTRHSAPPVCLFFLLLLLSRFLFLRLAPSKLCKRQLLHAMEDWYGSLDARVLDLVSDYAGRELFCLEGDSLVLECLDDSQLDFEGEPC